MLTKADELPEIIVMRETLLCLLVCSSIPPERMRELPQKVRPAGTTNGWQIPDFEEHPEMKPLKCADYEGRWHYVLVC